jgi:ribonuclease P protein component
MADTLHKAERLNKKKIIERMFAGGAHSFSIFPLRVVYLRVEDLDAPVAILISVSKRRFKRAVKRNRVKRQLREAFRKNKHPLATLMKERNEKLVIGFIYLADRLSESFEIEEKMRIALMRIEEKISSEEILLVSEAPSAPAQIN